MQSEFVFKSPYTIAQISFSKKNLVENNLLMIGDCAGMIAPLCGNGMSMALHSSKIAAYYIDLFLRKQLRIEQMQTCFIDSWNREFSSRMFMGRVLQRFFGSMTLSNLFVAGFQTFPFLAKSVISKTHGKEF